MHNASTGVTMEFTYNHEGIRTQKVKKVNDEIVKTTDYLLYGKKIIRMTKGSDTLLFHYDEKGSPIMMRLNGTPYTYVKNLQGDVVGLIDSTGALVVEYKYDAWGNPVSTRTLTTAYDALAELNPFRYRGYVWDEESHMHYLISRYYSPVNQRFINADALLFGKNDLLSNSLYAYCTNNPSNKIDTNGYDAVFFDEMMNPLISNGYYPEGLSSHGGIGIGGDIVIGIGTATAGALYIITSSKNKAKSNIKTNTGIKSNEDDSNKKYYIAIAFSVLPPVRVSSAMTQNQVYAIMHTVAYLENVKKLVLQSNYASVVSYRVGVLTEYSKDAYNLANRFSNHNVRFDSPKWFEWPHYHAEGVRFKDIHFWYEHE